MTTLADSIIDFPQPREDVFHASKEWTPGPPKRIRIWDGKTPWIITRAADMRALLSNPATSSDNTSESYPGASAAFHQTRKRYPTFVTSDGLEHQKRRRMLTGEFSVKRIQQLRPVIQQIVDELIDELLEKEGPVDLHEDFALALPTRLICSLLGIPYEDREFFQSRALAMHNFDATPEDAAKAAHELIDVYLGELIQRRIAEPGDDIFSRLITKYLVPGELTEHEVRSLGRLLLIAGHDTTASTLALSLLMLLSHPEQRAKLEADSELLPNAVEEMIRYAGLTHSGIRSWVKSDIEIGGQKIAAGESTVTLNPAVNRDPELFENPDDFDVERANAREHLAFGFGPHQCLGQNLARAELQIAIETIFRRIPTLRLAVPLEEVEYVENMHNYSLGVLPATW